MKKLITISLAALYILALPVSGVLAQSRPGTLSYYNSQGTTIILNSSNRFTVSVIVDTGGLNSAGADVYTRYNTSQVEFVSGSNGGFYSNLITGWPTSDNGMVNMGAVIPSPAAGEDPQYKNGSGTFATLTFEPATTLAAGDTMTTTLSFDFALGSTTDSNIAGEDASTGDILGSASSTTFTLVGYEADDDDDDDDDTTAGPDISSVSPTSGRADIDIVMYIYGEDFGDDEGTVRIGTRNAEIVNWSDDEIVVIVPQISITSDTSPYQVRVIRDDGEYDTYYGYTYLAAPSTDGDDDDLVDNGLPLAAWFGFIPLNGVAAYWIKRKYFTKAGVPVEEEL